MIHSTKPPTTAQTGVVEQSRIILSRTPFCGVDSLCGVVDGLCGVLGGLCGVVDAICGATDDLIGSTSPQNTQNTPQIFKIDKIMGYACFEERRKVILYILGK